MIFFDYSFLSADIASPDYSLPIENDINSITLSNGTFDDLYSSNDVDETSYIDNSNHLVIIPDEWDFKTILHAKFEGNLQAGNVDFVLDNVDGVLLMRRAKDDFKWIILKKYDINVAEDFNIHFQDRMAMPGVEYEYSITPILDGILGNYNKTTVTPMTNNLVVIDPEEIWSTYITDGFLDTTRTYPSNPVQTLYNKYPTIVRNTISNYDTVTVSGTWLPADEDSCHYYDITDSKNFPYITAHAKNFIDFLTNDKPKIIKASDSRMWLVWVNDSISDSADQYFMNRKISFTATEIGDPTNNQDLLEAGFLDENIEEYI